MPADVEAIDAAPSAHDAGSFDAAALPVVCASSSCATSLTQTTLSRANGSDRVEFVRGDGFCALLHDGTVACWGANEDAQLGRGEDAGTAASATPARVSGLSNIIALNGTCAIDESGGTWCWGRGPYLRSDATSTTLEPTPVKLPIPPATRVGATSFDACAVVEGGVLCWGENGNGQVSSSDGWVSRGLAPRAIAVPPGAPIRDLVLGRASFAVREDGTVLSWGENAALGRVSSLFPDSYPQPIVLAGVSGMDVFNGNACAVAGGVAYCWWNSLPEPVVTPESVVQIATTGRVVDSQGTLVIPHRWCACAASGAVYCWGYNQSGQAGDGTKDFAYKAVKVNLPGPAAQVKTTLNTTCALLTDGKVFCWGGNFYGQLGNGKLKQPSLVPQEVVLP